MRQFVTSLHESVVKTVQAPSSRGGARPSAGPHIAKLSYDFILQQFQSQGYPAAPTLWRGISFRPAAPGGGSRGARAVKSPSSLSGWLCLTAAPHAAHCHSSRGELCRERRSSPNSAAFQRSKDGGG
ncbi:hypothetical protein Pden_4884 (plasmid) [Paracoccus denitrificans PD1222]|uniref:Uncharacterized protein n=1 Tax=Paracoccus denitrificans (strain Pd 1222) TaxID=318586 RepID=A1BBQ0_PARDP|nr:hypothetical protein Pden_4884 [Paracoccus denitrificans PD1222]